jgi:ribonuclease III
LQELVVAAYGELPSYRVASAGPDHDKTFSATVFVEGDAAGTGSGKSKKEAEQNAARVALLRLSEDRPGSSGGFGASGKDVRARAS